MKTIIHINNDECRTEVQHLTEKGKMELCTHGEDTLTLVVQGKTYSANILLEVQDEIIKASNRLNTQHETGNSGNDTSTGDGQQQ